MPFEDFDPFSVTERRCDDSKLKTEIKTEAEDFLHPDAVHANGLY